MSDQPTLYRMVGNSYPAEKEEALEDGWLVPVEPTISGIAMTSKPNLSYDGKYTVVLLMDEPLDSLTMHNRVTLIGEPT